MLNYRLYAEIHSCTEASTLSEWGSVHCSIESPKILGKKKKKTLEPLDYVEVFSKVPYHHTVSLKWLFKEAFTKSSSSAVL